MNLEQEIFKNIYKELKWNGEKISPRGQLVLEIENFNYILPPYVRFVNFESRKLNLNYIKREFQWYLRGEKYDDSIIRHANLWKSMINKDGSINSNYGQYIFGEENQFDRVIEILKQDKDSRRASIAILNKDHLLSNTNDVPCTYSINFRIRDNYLNMTVRMRSQDSVFGMGNDVPAFSFIHEMLCNSLKEFYPDLKYGEYYHSSDSFHIYERHFEMMDKIVDNDKFTPIICPVISGSEEVKFLRKLDFTNIPEKFKFTKWLNTFDE